MNGQQSFSYDITSNRHKPTGRPPMAESARVTRDVARFWASVKKSDGCWEWTGPKTHDGYARLWCSEIMERIRASRYVFRMQLGRFLSPKEYACHHCDNPICVRPDHLFVGSNADNLKDMSNKGRHWLTVSPKRSGWQGILNPKGKLTAAQVIEVLEKAEAGTAPNDIAKQYGISGTSVRSILHGENWGALVEQWRKERTVYVHKKYAPEEK